MYRVPQKPRLPRQTPILLICGYYAVIGSFFALGSCSYIGTLIIGIAVSPPETLSSGMNAEIFWTALLLLLNASRLSLLIGLLRTRRWAYRGIIALETFTIIHTLYRFFIEPSPTYFWILLASGIIAGAILNYLADVKVRRYFHN